MSYFFLGLLVLLFGYVNFDMLFFFVCVVFMFKGGDDLLFKVMVSLIGLFFWFMCILMSGLMIFKVGRMLDGSKNIFFWDFLSFNEMNNVFKRLVKYFMEISLMLIVCLLLIILSSY